MISVPFLRFRLPVLALSFAVLGLTASCDRKEKDNDDTAPIEELQVTSSDHATADNDDAVASESIEQDTPAEADMSRAINAGSPAAERRSMAGGCATRTWDPATHTLTIDFGAVNCTCNDGRERRGQLIAVFSGRPNVPGTIVTITRQNYFVNDNQHLGTKVITYTDYNAWQVVMTGGQINFADGRTATWTADRTVTRTAAPGVPTTFTIRGTASGVNRKGNHYSAAIDDAHPLVKRREAGCYNVFVDGILTVRNNTRDRIAVLNYNPSGATPAPCDDLATVSVNGGAPRQIHINRR